MGRSTVQVSVDSLEEEILARVAAIDVGKDAGVVCMRTPHAGQPGKRVSTVWTVSSRTRMILELADRLAGEGVERVVMEATSDYWRPFYYLLEARGVSVWLVNARDVKNVPGRPKTDKLDSVWLAKADRARHAATQFRAADRDPAAARLHPAAQRLDRRPVPTRAAAGEAAGGRVDQAVLGGHRHDGRIGPADDRGADRRRTRPPSAGRAGQGPAAGQAGRAYRGADRSLRWAPRRARRTAASPNRRAHRADRASRRAHRAAHRRLARRAGTGPAGWTMRREHRRATWPRWTGSTRSPASAGTPHK